ncbi:transcriptional regulatory protein [Thermus composti]|uniref:Transcriptional regulatory protein n=1 Tax=Thermus composti TaxID=532059 RepID=A0ABV6Q1A2_9DEIN|nr:response regulator [Thermus composti]GGN01894.1 transcriptional regulatory protein [Thermus composti]
MDGFLASPPRALIVEDDRQVAALHRAFLEEEGFGVLGVVGRFQEAWASLSGPPEEGPDLVLLDLYLPDGHGLDLLPALEGIYTIVITAAKDVPTVERALLGGAMDYLVKPFGRARFREALARFRAFWNLKAKREVSQADLDHLLGRRPAPKGLDPLTMDRILRLLGEGGSFTVEEVAEVLGLSRVTAWRYLEALRREGRVRAEPLYKGAGRPSRVYRLA